MRRNVAAVAAILVALCAADSLSAQGTGIVLTGIVPTRCTAAFVGDPVVVDAHRVDLGLLTRACNQGDGYRVVLHTPDGLTGAVVLLAGRRVPLSRTGATVLVDANGPESLAEAAFVQFDGTAPMTLPVTVEVLPKGQIF